MHLLLPLSVLVVTWAAWTAICLFRNYRIARTINLPIVISPTGTINPFWLLTYKLVPSVLPFLQSLPFNLGTWSKYAFVGWQYPDKHAVHDRLGPAFVLCTPGINEVIVADPAAVNNLLSRRKDFIKPPIIYDGMNAFGKNLDSVEGETWQRHRKLTAPNFNERVSSSVWAESLRQASQMLDKWTSSPDGTKSVVEDTATVALHVLTYAGLGVQYAFKDAGTKIEAPHRMTYRDALHLILSNFTLVVLLPMKSLTSSFMPANFQKVGEACQEFKLYMKEMVDGVKASVANGKGREAHNLLGALVQASQAEAQGLSDDELYGNLFIYNLAGHETTANTVATAIAYLAAEPRWQDWIVEEIRAVAGSSSGIANWKYEEMWPQLTRCQAVQYETLRVHGSVVYIPKGTPNAAQALTIGETEHIIPPNTFVLVNSQALHSDTQVWGDDALEWRPDRWIVKPGKPGEEELVEPEPGTFVGWASGPRVCPGKKFSQVEMVGVLATLFCDHKVAPKQKDNETAQQAKKRLERMIDDSSLASLTLQMNNPRDVALVWSTRE